MKNIFILLAVLIFFSCDSCKTTEKVKHEKVDDGDVLKPPEGYGNKNVQRQEKTKDSLIEFQNSAAKARPQPCVQVAGLQETGKTTNTASFSWTSTGVNKYYVYKAGIYIGTATSNNYTATGLQPNTPNQFTVAGVGKGNKVCPLSLPITITTLPVSNPPPSGGGEVNLVFLQFDADTISGTSWNTNGDIISLGSGLTEDKKLNIFNHAKTIYAKDHPKVLFTMDKALWNAADPNYSCRVVYTTNSSWYGSAGGVAFVNSFNHGTCWVFTELLNYVERNIGLADVHEIGHVLGLYHTVTDTVCNLQYGLSVLCGDGIWRAPIMGGSYTDYEHIFYTPSKGQQYGILWKQKSDCQPHDEDQIIESHLK